MNIIIRLSYISTLLGDAMLDPKRHRDSSHPFSLPYQVGQDPAVLSELDRLRIERSQLVPAKGATNQKPQDQRSPSSP